MTILGSHIEQEIVAAGQFHCPKCNTMRRYQQGCITKRPTWQPLSIFMTQILDEFVLCQACWQTYRLEVLQYNPGLPADRLKLSVKYALESGIPAQVLQDQLVDSGMNDAGATRLVNSASDSPKETCPNCGSRQISSLLRCNPCSRLLTPTY